MRINSLLAGVFPQKILLFVHKKGVGTQQLNKIPDDLHILLTLFKLRENPKEKYVNKNPCQDKFSNERVYFLFQSSQSIKP
jgi:hypothetical protein